MALEIERRFLVHGQAWRQVVSWQSRLCQGYLAASADGMTLRVRSDGREQAWLTLKFPAAGIARHEFDYTIPAADGEALLQQCPQKLLKCRHGLDLPGGDWVLDVFEAENAPLVIAEVELEHAEAPVPLPPWCLLEITGEGAFSNAALARRPFATWPQPERQSWLERLAAAAASVAGG
ncbi:MAG: CYTH domain-containing protein [Cyanobium sp.]